LSVKLDYHMKQWI